MATAEERIEEMRKEANNDPKYTMDEKGNSETESSIRNRITNDPIPFKSTCDSLLITSYNLGQQINKLFRPFFRDYAGCNIVFVTLDVPAINMVGASGVVSPFDNIVTGRVKIPRFEVELYFQEGINANTAVNGGIPNIISTEKNIANNYNKTTTHVSPTLITGERINATKTLIRTDRRITLTDDTKESLEEFFQNTYKRESKVKYTDEAGKERFTKAMLPNYENGLILEVADSMYYTFNSNLGSRYLKVCHLDLILLLRKIYGETNDFDHKVSYDVKSVRPLDSYIQGPGVSNVVNCLFQISRLDCKEVEIVSNDLGMMSVLNGLPINRG